MKCKCGNDNLKIPENGFSSQPESIQSEAFEKGKQVGFNDCQQQYTLILDNKDVKVADKRLVYKIGELEKEIARLREGIERLLIYSKDYAVDSVFVGETITLGEYLKKLLSKGDD